MWLARAYAALLYYYGARTRYARAQSAYEPMGNASRNVCACVRVCVCVGLVCLTHMYYLSLMHESTFLVYGSRKTGLLALNQNKVAKHIGKYLEQAVKTIYDSVRFNIK